MNYRLTATADFVIRLEDGAWIPAAADNADFRDYQAWLAAGNRPLPYVPPPVQTPAPVTRLNYAAFRARWSETEKQALHAASAASWQLDDFIGLAQGQGFVDLDPAVCADAKAALVAANVLTQARADLIFALPG